MMGGDNKELERYYKLKIDMLIGGLGTRDSEERCPELKSMVEIEGNLNLWRTLRIYSHYGF